MLKTIKQRVLAAAKGTRVLEAVAGSEWRRRRLLIIAYHSLAVDEEHHWRRPLFFTREEFEQRLALMRGARLNVLSLGEGVERLRAGTLPPRSAVLTFDDGWADFATVVAPLLRRHGLPATVYATTYYSEKRLPIFPLMVWYLLWKGRGRPLGPAPQIGLPVALDLSESSARVTAEETIVEAADGAGLAAAERDVWAVRLADLLEVDYADLLRRRVLQLMTPEEMAEVTALGFDVQLHTHRHRVPRVREEFESGDRREPRTAGSCYGPAREALLLSERRVFSGVPGVADRRGGRHGNHLRAGPRCPERAVVAATAAR